MRAGRVVRRAGRPRGAVNAAFLERVQEHFRPHSLKTHADDVRRGLSLRLPQRVLIGSVIPQRENSRERTVHLRTLDQAHSLREPVPDLPHALRAGLSFRVHDAHGLREPRDPGHVLRPGAHAVLLAAAQNERLKADRVRHIKETDALRAVDLMTARAQEVDPLLLRTDRILPERLDRVDVEHGFRSQLVHQFRDLRDRLDRSDLVINIHDRDQDRIRPQRLPQSLQIDDAAAVDRDSRHFVPFLLKGLHRLRDRVMLERRRHDVTSLVPQRAHRGADRGVVRFRTAGGKYDLPRLALQCSRDLLPRLLHETFRLHPLRMHGGRISVIRSEDLHHDVCHGIEGPGRRCIVQICFSHAHSLTFRATIPTHSP